MTLKIINFSLKHIDMENGNSGLRTLNNRVHRMETILKTVETDNFEDVILRKVAESKTNKKKEQLKALKELFKKGVKREVGMEGIYDNIVKLIYFTVKFVETNAHKLAEAIGTYVTGDFKLTTAISLITDLVEDYHEAFLISSIELIVEIVFNNMTESSTTVESEKVEEIVEAPKQYIEQEYTQPVEVKRKKSLKKKKFFRL